MFRRLELRGLRILLTGASGGIGAALAMRLAAAGARLVIAARSASQLDEVARTIRERGGEATAVPIDVVDPEQRRRLIDEMVAILGGLDVLINNAGVGARGWFIDATPETLRRIMEVNVFAAAELTRLALPHLKRGREPMIVNVSSAAGRRGLPGCVEYCLSKFALTGWSESLRAELAIDGVHVLIVSPGAVKTGFRSHLVADRIEYGSVAEATMSAERCAEIIVGAMRRRKREVVITLPAQLLVWANRFAPWLVDWATRRHARRQQRAD